MFSFCIFFLVLLFVGMIRVGFFFTSVFVCKENGGCCSRVSYSSVIVLFFGDSGGVCVFRIGSIWFGLVFKGSSFIFLVF